MITTMPCGCQHQPCVGHAFTFNGVEPPLPEGWVYAIGWQPDTLFKRSADCQEAHESVDDGRWKAEFDSLRERMKGFAP